MEECSLCSGMGYILEDHFRKTCPKCGGRGTSNKIIGLGKYAQFTDKYITAKSIEEKREAIEEKIDDMQEEIEDKEGEIESLEEEISCLESRIRELRVKVAAI